MIVIVKMRWKRDLNCSLATKRNLRRRQQRRTIKENRGKEKRKDYLAI